MPEIGNKQKIELLELLEKKRLITAGQRQETEEIIRLSQKSAEDILLENNWVDAEEVAKAKAEIFGLKYESLINKKISDEILSVIPLEVSENYRIICFAREGNNLRVGMVDPSDFKAREAVDFLAKEHGLKVDYYVISDLSLNSTFKQYRSLSKEVSFALQTRAEEEAKKYSKLAEKEGKRELEEVIRSAPVAKIVSVIIRHAVEGRASDIHIEPLEKETRVRYRIDGVLRTSLVLPKSVHDAVVARIKVMSNLKLDETRMPQDGRIRLSFDDRDVDFRVSILPLVNKEKVVMRILDMTQKAPSLAELGFGGNGLKIIQENIKKNSGMLLVTGPTGSGKSTTLFSILNILNKEGINISTLEDPVEYFIKGVNHSQIRPEVDFTFASGLRSLLRQDPDIIMVGEIRDNETAELAIHASLTGHLVLSTLHTNDAIGTIARLLDMQVQSFLLSSTLDTVIAQRLVRKICKFCREEEKVPADILAEVEEELKKIPPHVLKEYKEINQKQLVFYRGRGCSRCGNSGYIGRVAVAEVLNVDEKIKGMIANKDHIIKEEEVVKDQQFITLRQDGILKVLSGVTTMEEIIRVI